MAAPESGWYFSRDHIENSSPSRLEGMSLEEETSLRSSFCEFLEDLGMRMKIPQLVIATAIVFTHRFYLRQSHLKNDRFTIASSCMFLASRVEELVSIDKEIPAFLKEVVKALYEVNHGRNSVAALDTVRRPSIVDKDVYNQQEKSVLLGERLVMVTLDFDMNIDHPYEQVLGAIQKFKWDQKGLQKAAFAFVNDSLCTSLCLQFKPHVIAVGAIFLASKALQIKLLTDGEKSWWEELEVTLPQLTEVSDQILEVSEWSKTQGEGIFLNLSRSDDPGSSVMTSK